MKTIITVHSTDSTPGMHLTGKDVDRQDRSNGYSKCGYHVVISRDGELYEARSNHEASIHDDDEAKEAFSICLVGGCDYDGKPSDNFTLPQWETLRTVIRYVGETNKLTSVRSKTPAVTGERINQIIWRPNV